MTVGRHGVRLLAGEEADSDQLVSKKRKLDKQQGLLRQSKVKG